MTSKNGERVAIIGGGLSGLAVAWNLRGSGIGVDFRRRNARGDSTRTTLVSLHDCRIVPS